MASLKLILFFFSAAPRLSLIPKGGTLPNTKTLFFQLAVWDDELLSTPKNYSISKRVIIKIQFDSSPLNPVCQQW